MKDRILADVLADLRAMYPKDAELLDAHLDSAMSAVTALQERISEISADHAAQVEALEAEVARLTAPQDVDLCELASELEKVNEEKVIAEVEALTNGRTDPYWAGFSQACEEIAHRLGVPFKESTPESPT